VTVLAVPATRREQTRARYPDETGFIEREGVRVFWERYGDGSPTILLMPTWSILHSRHWKSQIHDLARHFRVVTFDGRGNGRSDRPRETSAYTGSAFVADAIAVLDASGTDRAVVAGLSMGAGYALQVAATHPDRVLGAILIGASIDLDAVAWTGPGAEFERELDRYEGWDRYNANHWRADWPGFTEFFFGQVFSEPHSTKPIEDMVGWALETDPEVILAAEYARYIDPPAGWVSADEPPALAVIRRVTCPTLVIHGDQDRISSPKVGRRLAKLLGARLVMLKGSGHAPMGRDPVKVNLLMREFVASVGEAAT
jgi:pimeloyl-ACP methyl ester carboxylesterase